MAEFESGFERVFAERLRVRVELDPFVKVTLSIGGAIRLIGQLQLALRQPGNVWPTAVKSRELVDGLSELVALNDPVLLRGLQAGFDASFDVRMAPWRGKRDPRAGDGA